MPTLPCFFANKVSQAFASVKGLEELPAVEDY